jgi:signal transduction histidine kinase
LEAFLRLDRMTVAADLFRARTVYVAAAFLFVQILNLTQMYFAYGGWILDHTLLVVAIILLVGSAVSLRYSANFDAYSILWGGVTLLGVAGTSFPSKVGINSALLPQMVAGVVIVAILGSRRSLVIYSLSALVMVFCLHLNASTATYAVLTDPVYIAERNWQRTMQAAIAITLIAPVMGIICVTQENLFQSLESNLAKSRAAELARSQFLADMSHELRTPLNGVLGMNQLLLRGELNDQQRGYARIIDDCGAGMITVIDDILDLSRLEASRIELKPTDFDPARMLDSVMALHQANARSKGLRLQLLVEAGLPDMVHADHGRLRQIVGNLVSNAVKFTDEGDVVVALRGREMTAKGQEGRWWMNIFVQDSGIGITPDRIGHIFERFEQAQDGQTNTVRGSGLGLAICRELTHLFGGEISVTSEPGQGSRFCVALPLDAVADPCELAEPQRLAS